jgi:hypothetical protein
VALLRTNDSKERSASIVLPKRQILHEPHSATSQKSAFFIVTAVKTTSLVLTTFCLLLKPLRFTDWTFCPSSGENLSKWYLQDRTRLPPAGDRYNSKLCAEIKNCALLSTVYGNNAEPAAISTICKCLSVFIFCLRAKSHKYRLLCLAQFSLEAVYF